MTSDREVPLLKQELRTMMKWSINNRGVTKSLNKLVQSQSTANLEKVLRAQKALPAFQASQKWTRPNNKKKCRNQESQRIADLLPRAIE